MVRCVSSRGKQEKQHNGAEGEIISTEGLESVNTTKFGLVIRRNSCCSFIGLNKKINQTSMTHAQQIMC